MTGWLFNGAVVALMGMVYASFFSFQAVLNHWRAEDEECVESAMRRFLGMLASSMTVDAAIHALAMDQAVLRSVPDRMTGVKLLRSLIVAWIVAACLSLALGGAQSACTLASNSPSALGASCGDWFSGLAFGLAFLSFVALLALLAVYDGWRSLAELADPSRIV